MTGTPSIAASRDDLPPSTSTPAIHAVISDLWRQSRPFAQLPPTTRLAYLHEHGMHGDAPTSRIGPDAYDIRPDTEVGDACETAAQLLRALIATLEVLSVAPDASSTHSDACAGCVFLARQAAGAIAVIAAGVFPGYPARPASNDE